LVILHANSKHSAQSLEKSPRSSPTTTSLLGRPRVSNRRPPAKSSSTTAKEAKSGEKPAKETSGNEAGKESAKAPPAETGEQTHGEKYYSERMSKLQDRLEIDQRELSVLEQKLAQNQMQYYPDPNKGLLQESGPTAMSDIHKLQDQIDKKRAEVAADQEAIDDLREQLRREGGDAGWLR